MIAKEFENRNTSKLSITVKKKTLAALNQLAKENGNRSFIVNKALERYIGLKDEDAGDGNEEPELKAS